MAVNLEAELKKKEKEMQKLYEKIERLRKEKEDLQKELLWWKNEFGSDG